MSNFLRIFVSFINFLFVFQLISAFVVTNESNDKNVDSIPLTSDEESAEHTSNQLGDGFKNRDKRSALLSSGSTQLEGSIDPMKVYRDLYKRYDTSDDEENKQQRGECKKRRLRMCSTHTPFNSTVLPNIIGDKTEEEVNQSIPFFNLIAKSGCNKRLRQLLCTFLEPPCHNGRAIPPCKKFCRVSLEGCAEYIPATLELSSVFDCRQYPDSTDPTVCVNLALGNSCANDEFHCPDLTCISKRWVCDGVRDCIFAADEANCNDSKGKHSEVCSSEEFECDRKCVPLTWKCDGDRDCQDNSDETNCTTRPQCGPDRFKCADGYGCIPRRWVCDGKEECRDGSDEVNCAHKECSRGDFKCDNGICIPNIWRCDGAYDCKDQSDEKNCGNVNSNQLRHISGYGGNGGTHNTQTHNMVSDSHQSAKAVPAPAPHSSHSVNAGVNPYTQAEHTGFRQLWTTS